MAKSNKNVVTHGLSGKVGDLLVFRQRHGVTVVTKVPSRTNANTERQQGVRRTFKQAAVYAKAAIADAELKKLYGSKTVRGQSAYNLALADFFTAPEILDVDTSAYSGAAGSIIRMQVTDNFLVKKVEVAITSPDNSLIEKGDAVMDPDGLHWSYTTTQANQVLAGSKITVTASDLPGNLTSSGILLS